MPRCPACGVAVGDADRFCAACGRPLPAHPAAPGTPRPGEMRAFAGWTRALSFLLALAAGLAVVAVVSGIVEIALIERAREGRASAEEIQASDDRVLAIGFAQSVVQVATGVSWLVWQYRAQTNLRRRRPDARYSPGWAVGWWLIPLANLFMPYRTMRELWQGSTSDGSLTEPSTRISIWYLVYLTSIALTYAAATRSVGSPDLDAAATAARVTLGADIALAIAGVLAIGVVTGIARGQLARETTSAV